MVFLEPGDACSLVFPYNRCISEVVLYKTLYVIAFMSSRECEKQNS